MYIQEDNDIARPHGHFAIRTLEGNNKSRMYLRICQMIDTPVCTGTV